MRRFSHSLVQVTGASFLSHSQLVEYQTYAKARLCDTLRAFLGRRDSRLHFSFGEHEIGRNLDEAATEGRFSGVETAVFEIFIGGGPAGADREVLAIRSTSPCSRATSIAISSV